MPSLTRRIVPINDWAPTQEAMYDEHPIAGPSQIDSTFLAPPEPRFRSMSVSLPWRPRPRSSMFNMDSISSAAASPSAEPEATGEGASGQTLEAGTHNVRGILRRASISFRTGVMGLVHRRTSVPAPRPSNFALDDRSSHLLPGLQSRPTTAHSTWRRVRQVASFHRPSHQAQTSHAEQELADMSAEKPMLPVPGSGVQPPIIPRNTGAAARQAAANAHSDALGLTVLDLGTPKPFGQELSLDDHESGIGIALTNPDFESLGLTDEVDSDVDVGMDPADDPADISTIDFVSCLPTELAIHILALLDAATLATACRVSQRWRQVIANQHIWRESFLREKTTTCATSGPVKPGTGMGIPRVHPSNDWREIYRVKTQLDRRWDEGKVRPVYLNGHSDSIYCLQFDEEKIVTGSRDKTIRVWDMHTFACKLVIGPPEIIVDSGVSLLYDSFGNPTHYATLPETDSNPASPTDFTHTPGRAHTSVPALVSFPTHHKASILCLQYDNNILVTGSSDSTCIVYNVRSGYRPIRRLQHHSAAVLDLVFDDKHIVTCSKDISICVWDRTTGALLKQLRGHSGPVNAVQMRGNTIVSCSGDFRVKLWNIDTGKNIREFAGHTKGLACSQFSEDGRYVASAGNDKVIRVWDANTGECVREMKAHENLVRSLHVDSVSGRLVSGSYDTDIKVWDMETGQPLLDFPRWHKSWVLSAKSDYRRIVSTGQDPKILVMDFGAGVKGIEMLESCRRPEVPQSDGGYI